MSEHLEAAIRKLDEIDQLCRRDDSGPIEGKVVGKLAESVNHLIAAVQRLERLERRRTQRS